MEGRQHVHTQSFKAVSGRELTASYSRHWPVLVLECPRTWQHFRAAASQEARGVLDIRPIIL